MRKILFICVCLVTFSGISKAQSKDQGRVKVVQAFLTDFYDNSAPAKVLIEKYMYLKPTQNADTIRLTQMTIDTLAKSVRTLTQSKYDRKKVQIVPFSELKIADKPSFGEGEKNVYAIKIEDEVIMYLFFRQNRILSFYHFQKQKGRPGEPGFFLVF
ncbi:hypothetical protein QNI19_38185 [Cytophagaceae bacterium DM2B3-1]|uniref:DUF3887 domain-containing protein n=1 Tax=Xanthocytophaga flava TaxID=3048013 RepID=A0ABT7CYK2_9BACT|nr:hypothetical protein [Xanthocytophaga flavus]MDJ1498822.1 hypothetical protein [Xanthocytophaga flavus]